MSATFWRLNSSLRLLFPLALIFFLLTFLPACSAGNSLVSSTSPSTRLAPQTARTSSTSPILQTTGAPLSASPISQAAASSSDDWHSLALAQPLLRQFESFHLMNYDVSSGQGFPLLAQTLVSPVFDGVSPDGRDLLYHVSNGSKMTYSRALSTRPGTDFFFSLPVADAGNALWLPDSRHVLVLLRSGTVFQVDSISGQIKLLFSLSPGEVDIASLTFFRAPYLYFVGAAGACEDILCRVKQGSTDVQRVSFRSIGAHYWLSPDSSTIFFANPQGPAGQLGIYAVHPDGTHLRLLRSYSQALPVGFASDNSLVLLRHLQQAFVVVKLGATPQADQVLLANAAPGATSLCPPSSSPGSPLLCDSSIALAPLAHALVVQATLPDNSSQLWSTNLLTGQQQILQVAGAALLPAPVQLLGWDRLSAP